MVRYRAVGPVGRGHASQTRCVCSVLKCVVGRIIVDVRRSCREDQRSGIWAGFARMEAVVN